MNDAFAVAGVNLGVVLPELLMVIFALLVMLADIFVSPRSATAAGGGRSILPWLALAGVIITGFVVAQGWGQPLASFQGMATNDHFALGLRLIVLVATGYDFFGPKAQPRKEADLFKEKQLSGEQLANRLLLREVMLRAGWKMLPHEWWHFDCMEPSEAKKKLRVIE